MRLPKPLLIALPLAALAIAGCGGGGEDSSASTATTEAEPALTKAALISQGDSICAEANAAIGSVGESEAEVPAQITQVSDLYVGMVEKLKALGTPTETAGYDEFIAAADELSKVEGEAKLAAEREDTEALGEAASAAAPVLEEFESVAGTYGFKECSEGPRAPSASSTTGSGSEEEASGGVEEGTPEASEEAAPEEVAPEEEAAPETGGAGGGVAEEAAPEGGGTGGTSGGGSGGIGPG